MKTSRLEAEEITRLCRERDYAGLETLLADAELAVLLKFWPRLPPLDRLVAFKLLDAGRALEFYTLAPFKEKYFLFSGFSVNSIAPVLEDLPPLERRRFTPLPREFYDRMFRKLLAL